MNKGYDRRKKQAFRQGQAIVDAFRLAQNELKDSNVQLNQLLNENDEAIRGLLQEEKDLVRQQLQNDKVLSGITKLVGEVE